jgi:biopolymer transport protein ExbD
MGGGSSNNDEEMITAINVTPLVDVVLVLLIILMVTASYIVSKSIPMDLPQASTAEAGQQPRTLAVSIDRAGAFYIDAEAVTEAQFVTRVRAYVAEMSAASQDPRATIAADTSTSHGQFIRAIDILRREHVTHFAINVRPEDLAQPQ